MSSVLPHCDGLGFPSEQLQPAGLLDSVSRMISGERSAPKAPAIIARADSAWCASLPLAYLNQPRRRRVEAPPLSGTASVADLFVLPHRRGEREVITHGFAHVLQNGSDSRLQRAPLMLAQMWLACKGINIDRWCFTAWTKLKKNSGETVPSSCRH